ncbi:hypothetical protein C8F01DRAFT_1106831 [Mycena amicta]|nr:hypothetical protein C8F01DRAFT_1106831 [Mycena amicta]
MFDLNGAQLDFDPFSDFVGGASSTDEFVSPGSAWKGKGVSRPMDIPSTSRNDREYYPFSSPLSPSSFASSSLLPELDDPTPGSSWKGKDVAIPAASLPNPRDVFDLGQPALLDAFSSFSSHFSSLSGPGDSFERTSTSMEHGEGSTKGKGKEKELPPTLPPLTFTPTEFGYDEPSWPSSGGAGPSSIAAAAVVSTPTALSRPLFRRRSLPSLAATNSNNPSNAKSNKFRMKVNSSTLARKLLFRKYDGDACPTPPSSPTDGQSVHMGVDNCFAPWRNDSVFRLDYDDAVMVKGGRHQSLPFPISALDLIPAAATDAFAPVPFEVINYFDDILPRELRVHVLFSLIAVHEADHARAVRDGQWTVAKASSSRNKWVGRDKGLRELVRFSRVSKGWQSLVFDGQMWSNLDLHAFPLLPKSLLLRIARTAGSFIRDINVAGHVGLSPETLIEVTDNLSSLSVRSGSLPFTYITELNLRGCSSVTTGSLHHILIQSRALEHLCLKGLGAVTNATCNIIARYCPKLVTLDLGRCASIDASGIRNLASTFVERGEYMPLKELRLSGLKHVDDSSMAALGRAAPFLEVLDLSYSRGLHNTAIEALIACRDDDKEDLANGIRIVTLNAREAGRNADEGNKLPPSIEDDGIIRLLNTTPLLRRLDLEDASAITDAEDEDEDDLSGPQSPLEHLVISGALEITESALLALIRGCKRLRVLEVDNTRLGPPGIRELADAKFVAIDCRGFGEPLLKELAPHTRPRRGWLSYGARALGYLDARDGQGDDLRAGNGQDELDERRVVVKTFYGWQTVDAVQASREKRRKARTRRSAHESLSGDGSDETSGGSRGAGTRWWSPGGRRSPPVLPDAAEGCVIM